MRFASCLLLVIFAAFVVHAQEKKTREQKVREDRERVEADGFWIYNDLPKAFAEAERTGKPILVVMRCIPCEECVKLDDELVDNDPAIRPLLEKFVCARQVSTNGLDLSLFQFDTDQSWAVFMLNADKTIYGRFGTRSHRTEWMGDVSFPGLAKAMQGALALHANYPANKESLAGKRGQPLEFASPEKYPALKDRYTDRLATEGNVVQSCIHCHQIGDARRDYYRAAGKPLPERLLFPAPHPKVVGLTMDPKEMATVIEVAADSPAAAAGLRAGDRILALNGQPLVSIADMQWALDAVEPDGAEVPMLVERDGRRGRLTLKLADGWRRAGDLSWRVSSWGLRRMSTGGLRLESLPDEDRQRLDIPAGEMALRVSHVGQYGPHSAAKNAGFRADDVLIEVDGRRDLMLEDDLLVYGVTERRAGEQVPVKVLRAGREIRLMLPMQQ